jgi:PTH1 family peptidyl-tRNA hydrolase
LKSIIQHLGSQDFPRLKVGIGMLETDDAEVSMRTPEYVLGRFTSKEKPIIAEVCSQVAEAVDCILNEGITTAMNNYNSG